MSNDRKSKATNAITNAIVSYIIYKKEYPDIPPTTSILRSATYIAKSGLNDNYSTSEFIYQLQEDFQKLASLLKQVADEITLEEKAEKGILTTHAILAEKTLSVKDIAEKLHISTSAITQAIRNGQLNASKVGKDYMIKEKDFTEYKNNRKRK